MPKTEQINIMLVSHTNVGKTTLVRTLIGQDVGKVLDAPDVTTAVAAYDLVIANPMVADQLGALRLWDTPGFGDSERLARRLRQKNRWLAWLIREVWDRRRNRRLWRSQQVALDLRARADVILYLLNALERPVDAVYVAPELEVLEWIGKPVLAILNQVSDQEDARISEWRQALALYPVISKTLDLDSYTRCWLQELVLYDEIGRVLPEQSRHAYRQLAQRVAAGHRERFAASAAAIATHLLAMAGDRIELDTGSFGPLKEIWHKIRNTIAWDKAEAMPPDELAMQALAQRFTAASKAATDQLIAINRLSGISASEIVEVAGEKFTIDGPLDESTTALAGGVLTGATAGLKADLMSGGLSHGLGALVGGTLGALGAAALARGYNVYTSKGKKVIAWSPEALTEAFGKSAMLYLAIAHFGRGQGEWRRKADPAHWFTVVNAVLNRHQERLLPLWSRSAGTNSTDAERATAECKLIVTEVLLEVLSSFYPEQGKAYLAKQENMS
jgi:hypothetical protein